MDYPLIKVRIPKPIANDASITITMADGTEHDISNYLRSITFTSSVGNVTTVTLEMVATLDIEAPAVIRTSQIVGMQ